MVSSKDNNDNNRAGDTKCNRCARYSHQRTGKGTGSKRMSGDRRDYNIINIDENTEKSPGDLR